MDRLLLALAAAVAGAAVVAPFLNHALLSWIGWQGVVPLLLGWLPPRRDVRGVRPRCRTCRRSLVSRQRVPVPASSGAAVGTGTPGGPSIDGPAPGPPGPTDGLPVLPWLLVRGRCRSCGEPIGRWVLGVEIATGVGFAAVAARLGWSALLPAVLVLVAGLVAMSAVDLVCSRIPTRFVYLTGLGATVAVGAGALVEGEAGSLVGAAVGAAVCFGLLAAQYLIALVVAGGNFGPGDVRLGTVIGLVVGWLGWMTWPDDEPYPVFGAFSAALTALIIGALAAAVFGLVLRLLRGRGQLFPFGPWLSLGGVVAVLLLG